MIIQIQNATIDVDSISAVAHRKWYGGGDNGTSVLQVWLKNATEPLWFNFGYDPGKRDEALKLIVEAMITQKQVRTLGV